MFRYRLTLEYDGGAFNGWQAQTGLPTVQASLERALFAITGRASPVTGAGRTDTGVHALGQVAHLDTVKPWAPERLMAALNAHLRPEPVAVLAARAAAPDFHARFSAIERRYLYRILSRRGSATLAAGRVWHHPQPLAADLMHAAAQSLVGRHDFTSFRAAECQSQSPLKSMNLIHVHAVGADEVHVELAARSFLHHQVRNIVGTLVLVGRRQVPVTHIRDVLALRDRAAAGQTAPPDGLYLVEVRYGRQGARVALPSEPQKKLQDLRDQDGQQDVG